MPESAPLYIYRFMTNSTERLRATSSPAWFRILRALGVTFMWFVLALLTLWAVAALYVDFRCRRCAFR